MAGRGSAGLVEVMHVDAVVQLVPEVGQQERGRTHHRMRIVGGDFHHQVVRTAPRFGLADVFLRRRRCDGRAHRLGVQHRIDHGAAMRQVGTDHRRADAAEMRAQHAGDLAGQAFGTDVARFVHHRAQRHRRGEVHHRVAAVEQQRQHAAETAHHHPVFREQHAEPARFAGGRAANIDRHGHDLHVALRLAFQRAHQLAQRLVGRALAVAAEQPAITTRQREHRAPAARARQRLHGRGQPGLAAGALQDQRIGQPVALDHIANRHARLQQGSGFGRIAADAHPGFKQLPGQVEPPGRAATGGRVRGRHILHSPIVTGGPSGPGRLGGSGGNGERRPCRPGLLPERK